jgi:hypothetical protein
MGCAVATGFAMDQVIKRLERELLDDRTPLWHQSPMPGTDNDPHNLSQFLGALEEIYTGQLRDTAKPGSTQS